MFEELLARIGVSLSRHDLPYMVVGGQAVLLYGEPRLTRSIDIILGAGFDRVNELLLVAKKLSLKPIPEDIGSFVGQTMVLPVLDESTGIRVDFIFSSTPYETGAIERARKVRIKGIELCFASPEDVIIHKVFAGRARDIEDVRIIIRKNPDVDFLYIRNWLKEFDNSFDDKNFLKTFEQVVKR